MNNANKKRFAEIMAGMGEVFQKDVSKSLLKIYWEALKNLTIEDIEKAAGHIVATRTITGTIPLPAEIINAIDGNPDERAELAWRTLVKTIESHGYYSTVQFEDLAIGEAIHTLGGWCRISGDDPDWTEDNLKWRRKEFINLYNLYSRQKCEPKKLVGYHEDHNRNQYENFIPKITFINTSGEVLAIENDNEIKRIAEKEKA